MGSFNMHIAISKNIKEKFSFGDEFILGTVLPDLYKILLGNRKLTHFEKKIGKEFLPDIEKFCKDYKNKKSEVVYGYLAHLIQDKVWFKEYNNKRYVQKIEDGKYYKYLKDDTIHKKEEYINDMYTDYSIISKYLTGKYSLKREETNEKIKKCVLENKNILEKEELINLIDTKIIDYSSMYNPNNPSTFLTEEEMDKYYEETTIEVEKILKQFIEE